MTATAYFCPGCKKRVWRDFGKTVAKSPYRHPSFCESHGKKSVMRKSRDQKTGRRYASQQ